MFAVHIWGMRFPTKTHCVPSCHVNQKQHTQRKRSNKIKAVMKVQIKLFHPAKLPRNRPGTRGTGCSHTCRPGQCEEKNQNMEQNKRRNIVYYHYNGSPNPSLVPVLILTSRGRFNSRFKDPILSGWSENKAGQKVFATFWIYWYSHHETRKDACKESCWVTFHVLVFCSVHKS